MGNVMCTRHAAARRFRGAGNAAVLGFIAGLLLPAAGAAGSVFHYFNNDPPTDISPAVTGSYQNVDVSAYCPAGTTGVIIQMVNTSGSDYNFGCRKKGSGDTWMETSTGRQSRHAFFMIGVDASRVLQIYRGHANVVTRLIGYTTSGATFLLNATNKTPASGAWNTVDISGDTGAATAIGGIFIVKNTDAAAARSYGARKYGSVDTRTGSLYNSTATAVVIGLDGSERCQFNVAANVSVYLVGYITSGAVFRTNAPNYGVGTGSYIDTDITAVATPYAPSDPNGAIVEFYDTTDTQRNTGVRKNGHTYDYREGFRHHWAVIGLDGGDVFEQRVGNTDMDCYIIGYTLFAPTTISSAANQIFTVSDPQTAISTITVTDDGGTITAANDIRVRIPAGLYMLWDTTDTAATIGGTASAKVSTTVSYEDAGATLVLNVTGNFAADEYVTASGLSFTNFTASSANGNLEVEVNNDNVVTAADDKTIQIIGQPPSGTAFNFLASPIDFTPGATGSWQDVDVSSSVPAGATGAIVQMVNTSGTAYAYGLRKNGSTDTWMTTGNSALASEHRFFMIGVDANRVFEVYNGNAAVKTYLLGYTLSGVSFFTNAANKSVDWIGTWLDVNISANTGADTAIGGIFIVKGTGATGERYQIRKNGSTDVRYQDIFDQSAHGAFLGVDGSEVCQMEIENVSIDLYLVGYVTSGAYFFTNALNKSTATTGSYVDVDITADIIGSDDASGAFLETYSASSTVYNTAFRANGASYDYYTGLLHTCAAVGLDDYDIFEQKIADANMDVYLLGYTIARSNYRSVGTNSGTLYSTGVASITSGTSTVTFGGGVSLPIYVGQGDKLTIGATVFYILSRDSATQVTVQETAGSTLTNQAYTIVRAYNTLSAWETDRDGDLVAEGRMEIAVAYDDGDFTGAVTIDGSTTDATHYMKITVASGQRHAGQAGVGAVVDRNNSGTAITVSDNYTRLEWLQVRRTGGADGRSGVYVTNATNVVLDSLLVNDFNGATTCYGIRGDTSGGATVRNCVVYDGIGRGIVADAASAALTVQNCTVYGITGRGVSRVSGALTATNTIAMGCTIEDFGAGLTQSYNMSADASAAGAGSLPSRTAGNQFTSISSGNLNLHLKAGSAAIGTGSDLSVSFTADIDNGARSAPWDMGADESSASGTGQKQTPRVAAWRETAP